MLLCSFKKFEKSLSRAGFKKNDFNTKTKIIKETVKFGNNSNIKIKNDGSIVYLSTDGEEHKGYMFIKEYFVERYNTFPKFHLTNCSKIKSSIAKGNFNQRYEFSNSNVNDIIDKGNGKIYKDVVLQCCTYCRGEIIGNIDTTENFADIFNDEEEEIVEKVQTDIFGYVLNWKDISKHYREEHNYTCENCFLKPRKSLDNRFWHIHHIDGNKVNNKKSNLKCLCIDCHSKVDATHRKNFSMGSMNAELNAFLLKYR